MKTYLRAMQKFEVKSKKNNDCNWFPKTINALIFTIFSLFTKCSHDISEKRELWKSVKTYFTGIFVSKLNDQLFLNIHHRKSLLTTEALTVEFFDHGYLYNPAHPNQTSVLCLPIRQMSYRRWHSSSVLDLWSENPKFMQILKHPIRMSKKMPFCPKRLPKIIVNANCNGLCQISMQKILHLYTLLSP